MQLPEFLQIEDGTTFIRLTGHRVGLAHLVRTYNRGATAEMIAVHFPTLSLSQIHKVIAFYLDNQAEVNAYVAADDAELKRQEEEAGRKGDQVPPLTELRRRLEVMRKAGG